MKRNKILRIIAIIITICLTSNITIDVFAYQNRSGNFNRNYSLTGDGAHDVVSVAAAQLGKTGSNLGYSEQWCADFVSDCALLAGQSAAIPADANCTNLRKKIINAGGFVVSKTSAKPGDIVFYGTNGGDHVEIVYAASNGNISTYGGNSGSEGNLYNRKVKQHATQTMTIAYIVRPNYSGGSCGCSTSYAGTYVVNTASLPLTMRSGHGTGYSAITTIPKGQKVKVTKADGTWAHVEWNGYSGYCSMQYLKKEVQNPTQPVNNPIGVIDSISGGVGCINVCGWAFDKDDTSKCLYIHVYIGGPTGSGAPCRSITANKSRPDVNNVYGVGNNHGYSDKIITDYTGTQNIYVYAINIGSGEHTLLGSKQVYITKDTEQPKITRTYISEVTRDSYRVCAEISDNCGIKNVSIATWSQDGQTDLKWRGANYNGAGTYFIDIKRSEHSQLMNSLYYNHIYAYDYAGNCSVEVRDMDYRIKSDTGKNIAEGEYRIVTSKDSDFALSAANGGVTEGTNIQLYKNTSDKDQTFNISYVGDGFYKIIGTKSGLALDVYGEKYQLETNVMLSKYHAGANQQWMFKKLSDGVYSIVSRSNGLVLDFYKGIYENCTNVQVYEQNGGYNQQWKFKRVLKDSMVNFNITDVYRSNYLQQIDKINVKVDGKKLVRDVDYEVSYMLKDGRLSYVVMGKGNYCDKVVKTYTLKKEPESENESVKVPTVKPTEKETTAKPTEKQTTVRPTEKETETFEKEHTHSYTSTITKAATCTDNGIKTYKCSCGKSYTEIIEKTGHQHTHIRNSILADCTTEGYTGDTYCSDCGQKISSGNVIPQKGHKWDSGVITKNATSSEEGIKTYTCKVCGEKRTETIPMIKIPENGTIITDWQAGSQYKVTKSGVSGGTVEYKRPLSINVTVVNIPNTITYSGITYKVTSIAANAFKLNDNLKKVTMGDNIVEIGENAFANCGKLVLVKMSNNLVKIGDKAFYKCKSLTKITIPYKVRKIGYKAFYRCSNLRNIGIKTKKLTANNIGRQAFKGINSRAVFKVPADRVSSYKKILKAVGVGSKIRIK